MHDAARNHLRPLILVLLIVLALAVRLYRLTDPPLDFAATRQFHSVLITHWFYVQSLPSVPDWEFELARLHARAEPILEPPIMEWLAYTGFRLLGGEMLWLPRLLSSLWWVLGGVFLYRLAAHIASQRAAVAAAAIYLFLPFAIQASRSFQPDPMMVMLLIVALWAIYGYAAQPSGAALARAIGFAACAVFAKPSSVFLVFGAFGALTVCRLGIRRAIASRQAYLFVVLSLLPIVLYSGYGFLVARFLRGQEQGRFRPELLLTPTYWTGWLRQLVRTLNPLDPSLQFQIPEWTTLALLAAACWGALLMPAGAPRALMLGLWAGYGAFCLFFSYHASTHNYYHLPLIPIVALSLASLARRLLEHERWRWVVAVLLVVWGLAAVRVYAARLEVGAERRAQAMVDIGEQVGHSTRTVLLAEDFGLPLRYYGRLDGAPWPEALAETADVAAVEQHLAAFEGTRDYFIVTNAQLFARLSNLRNILDRTYPVLARTESYVIYDLRRRSESGPSG